MPAYEDKRDGRWRYRKRVDLPDGRGIRITGTPATDTKKAAEAAERAHIERVLHPERARAQAEVAAERKEKTTFREFAKRFMAGYLPGQKPSERKSKNQILDTHLIPFFGDMGLDEIRQEDVDAFTTAELKRCVRKTVNNRLAVLSTMLGYAVENKVIAKVTLRCHVRGRKAEDAPIIAVEAADVRKLVGAADLTYRVAILLAAEAGFRVGEIRGVQWNDIRGDEVTIRRAIDTDDNVGAPKHDRVRKVPLSPDLLIELQKYPTRGCGWCAGLMAQRCRTGRCSIRCTAFTSALASRYRSRRTARRCRGTRCGIRSAPSARSAAYRSRRFEISWATRTSKRRFATSP